MNSNTKNPFAKLVRKISKIVHDRKKANTNRKFREIVGDLKKTSSMTIIEYVEAVEPGSMKLERRAIELETGKVLARSTSTKVIVTRARSNDLVADRPRGMIRSRILDESRGSISPRN